MKIFNNIQVGDIVHCVRECKSRTLIAEKGKYYKIINISINWIEIGMLEYNKELPYAAIILAKDIFFNLFANKQKERLEKLQNLNKLNGTK